MKNTFNFPRLVAMLAYVGLPCRASASNVDFLYYDIGDIGCPDYSVAFDINSSGVIACTMIVPDCANDGHAVVWYNGELTDLTLETQGHPIGAANGISDTGVVVASGENPVVAVANGYATAMPAPTECDRNGSATWINRAGTVIPGDCWTPEGLNIPAIYLVESGTALALPGALAGYPEQNYASAKAANDHGVVVGFFSFGYDLGNRAFIWQDGVMEELINTLGGEIISARAISNSGYVAGGADTTEGHRAMLYNIHTGEMIALGVGTTEGVNNYGDAVGSALIGNHSPAMLYKDGAAIDLMPYLPSYMVSGEAWAINDYGWIVGSGDDGDGVVYWAWLLVPIYDKGDYDGDEDVDLHDFGHFQRCFAAEPYQGPEGGLHVGCSVFDFDDDVDLDLTDFDAFQAAFTGAITSGW